VPVFGPFNAEGVVWQNLPVRISMVDFANQVADLRTPAVVLDAALHVLDI
jgi:hypothetical protein